MNLADDEDILSRIDEETKQTRGVLMFFVRPKFFDVDTVTPAPC